MDDRELNALVAEKVFGEVLDRTHAELRQVAKDGADANRGRGIFVACECGYRGFASETPPPEACPSPRTDDYSSSGDGMLLVVEAMRAKGFNYQITGTAFKGTIHATFAVRLRETFEDSPIGSDASAPRAVALASLRALGVEIKDL